MQELLYLSCADIESLGIAPADITSAVEAIFVRKARGRAALRPKSSLAPSPGNVVEAMLGIDLDSHSAAVKWVSVSTGNKAVGLPGVQALLVLSETRTGLPKAVMNASAITGMRTAACTAVAAKYLARRESRRIGFIGAGLQARTHLDALRLLFPNLDVVTVYAGASPTAEAFTAHARSLGFDARRTLQPEDAVGGHDIVVTTIPPVAGLEPFLDPAWVDGGAFVSAVDLGRSWKHESFTRSFDIIATDDISQSEDRIAAGKMMKCGRFDCELGDLAVGAHPGRTSAGQKTALLFAGTALADLAAAMWIADEASRQGAGTLLEL